MSRRTALAATAAAVTVVLAGCGTAPPVVSLPTASAEPMAAPTTGDEPSPSPTPVADAGTADPSPSQEPSTEPSGGPSASSGDDDEPTGPTAAAIAELVAEQVEAAGDGAQHVVTDLDGDDVVEVVVAAIVEEIARASVWWWQDDGFGAPVTGDAGPGGEITSVRVTDLTEDGQLELLVGVGGGARSSLAIWTVAERGDLSPLRAVGGCVDDSHVYGATGWRLQSRGDAPPAIIVVCDDSPLPVSDWSEATYELRDGAYRVVVEPEPSPTASPTPSPSPRPSPSPDPSESDDDEDDDDGDDDDDGGGDDD